MSSREPCLFGLDLVMDWRDCPARATLERSRISLVGRVRSRRARVGRWGRLPRKGHVVYRGSCPKPGASSVRKSCTSAARSAPGRRLAISSESEGGIPASSAIRCKTAPPRRRLRPQTLHAWNATTRVGAGALRPSLDMQAQLDAALVAHDAAEQCSCATASRRPPSTTSPGKGFQRHPSQNQRLCLSGLLRRTLPVATPPDGDRVPEATGALTLSGCASAWLAHCELGLAGVANLSLNGFSLAGSVQGDASDAHPRNWPLASLDRSRTHSQDW